MRRDRDPTPSCAARREHRGRYRRELRGSGPTPEALPFTRGDLARTASERDLLYESLVRCRPGRSQRASRLDCYESRGSSLLVHERTRARSRRSRSLLARRWPPLAGRRGDFGQRDVRDPLLRRRRLAGDDASCGVLRYIQQGLPCGDYRRPMTASTVRHESRIPKRRGRRDVVATCLRGPTTLRAL